MKYGGIEFLYAEPFANSLVADAEFRAWVLGRTKFAPFAAQSRVLDDEMKARRGKSSANWWRSHYTEKCRCAGCSGKETDILAVFETQDAYRFALHFEVKQPRDRFDPADLQAAGYPVRAKCWVQNPPRPIVPHSDACSVLLCSKTKLAEYGHRVASFGSVITFEEMSQSFPHATRPVAAT